MAEVNVRVSDSGRLFPDAVVIKVDEQEIIAGQDGISPVVTVTEIGTAEAVSSHGYEVDVSDAAGVHTYSVYDGASAYAQAVAGGYSGTEEEFAADLIGFNTRAAEATAGATAAAAYADAASDSATAAATSESNAADSATAAASSASEAASSAGTATTAAGSASSSATAAAGSATTASNKASEAASSESNAASSATAASASATAAAASETAAASSASSAAGSATAAAASAAAIEEYEHDAEAWAIGKRGGVNVDSSDDTYHNNSKYHAEQAAANNSAAAQKASEAASSAQAASQSAQEASASATAASQAEGNAANSATAAAGSATAAAGSASTASTAATTAQGHATNAASSATAASGSATSAASSATAAGNAQTAAETAQAAAEDAQEAAEAVLESIPSDYTELTEDVDDLKSAFTQITDVVKSTNLLNPQKVEVGYIGTNGSLNSSESYRHTELIPVTSGETLYFSYWRNPAYADTGDGRAMTARFLCAYDANKNAVSASGTERANTYTVPSGISYIVISWSYSTYSDYQLMVSVGSSIPTQFDEYYEYLKIADDIKLPNYNQLLSNIASAALSNEAETLAADGTLKIANAPRFVKKNVGVSFNGKFSDTFSGLKIGKGYLCYRGKWLDITSTTVSVQSDTTDTTLDTQTHGLTITDYISVNLFMGDDGILHYSINTVDGTYSNTYDIGNEFNFAPFATAAQAMTDCKISVSYSDIKCPIWVIGDSYCGYALNRVMGNIRQLGFTNFMVDAVAGGVAYDNVQNDGDKSMIDDFLRLASFALPKILIWACEMNGTEAMNINIIGYISKFCTDNNIELILYKTPNVPELNHNQLNAFVESTEKRYIDAFDAVSSDSTGTWYTGFLSDDDVHPTNLGAQALAQKWLSDVPELMRN